MGTIEVTKDETKTTITFDKSDEDRNDFVYRVRLIIHEQFFKRENTELFHNLIVMFREMVKNVCDHGNGRAVLSVSEHSDSSVEFEFVDGSEELVSFADIRNGRNTDDWQKKSDSNCGVGLSMILYGYKALGIEQRIDDTKGGISYFGRYVPSN
jgi:hypothetical protein